MRGLLDGALDRSRVGVFLGAGTADLLRNEDFYRTWITSGLERTRPSDVWNHFPSTPVDVVAERFGLEGPRALRRGGLLVEHDRDRPRRRGDSLPAARMRPSPAAPTRSRG